jgi:hypothetical protein
LLLVFYVVKEEDVILDFDYFFDLDVIINNDGDVDGGDIVYQERVFMFKDGDDDEGGCHVVSGRHVVSDVGGEEFRVIR